MDIYEYVGKKIRLKKMFFEDGYLEKGMTAIINSIGPLDPDGCRKIWLLVEPFRRQNEAIANHDYFDDKGVPRLTAAEAGFYPKGGMDSYYLDRNDKLEDFVEIIPDDFFDTFVKQMPTFAQRQDSLTDQIDDLLRVATKLGMYDAVDAIKALNRTS